MSIHGSSGKKEFLHCRFQLEDYQHENIAMKPNGRVFPICVFSASVKTFWWRETGIWLFSWRARTLSCSNHSSLNNMWYCISTGTPPVCHTVCVQKGWVHTCTHARACTNDMFTENCRGEGNQPPSFTEGGVYNCCWLHFKQEFTWISASELNFVFPGAKWAAPPNFHPKSLASAYSEVPEGVGTLNWWI